MNKTKRNIIVLIAIIFIMAIGVVYLGISNYRTFQNLDNTKMILDTTQDELTITQENLRAETEKSIELSKNVDVVKEELEIANKTISELKDQEYKIVYFGDFKLTHYCCEKRAHVCGTGNGITATGTKVTAGRSIAVDPKVIPYGTKVYIEGYGWRTAEDCGGGVDGKHIDVAVNTHSDAMSMGVKTRGVWILVKNES